MGISFGSNNTKLFVGDNAISSAWLGNAKVYSGSKDYLTVTARNGASEYPVFVQMIIHGTVPILPSLEFSVDGENWYEFIVGSTSIPLYSAGEYVMFRAVSTNSTFNYKTETVDPNTDYISFSISDEADVSGNIMSLIDRDCRSTTIPCSCCFVNLFKGCATIKSGPYLPATTVTASCYANMFHSCTNLVSVGNISATEFQSRSCVQMFYKCSSLEVAPKMTVNTVSGEYAFYNMFSRCSSLESISQIQLNANTLTEHCYAGMFFSTAISDAIALPATNLAYGCYTSMFSSCSNLKEVPNLPATSLPGACYYAMFANCVALEVYSDYQVGTYPFRIPSSGTGTAEENALGDMFVNTIGSVGTPTINTTYYTRNRPIT